MMALLLASRAQAQPQDPPAPPPAKRAPILIRPVFGYSSASLSLSPENAPTEAGKQRRLDWSPNSALKVGARAGVGPFVATLTFNTLPADETATHGTSHGFELQFTTTLRLDDRDVAATVFYQRYRGFFLDNTAELFPRADAPLLAPQLSLSTYGANLLFFFSPRFSYDDAFVEYRPRARSGFSTGMRLALGSFTFDAGPNALIPGKLATDYGNAFGLTAVDATYASVGGGIGADWRPWGRLLLGFSGFIGATVSAAKYRQWGHERRTPTLGPSITTHLVAGYAGDLMHGGMLVTVDSDGMRIEGTDVAALRTNVLLFIGIRL
jgi:hypothetical protein